LRKLQRSSALALVLTLGILCSGFTCSKGTKNLAVASDAIAHSLANAQTASRQAVTQGLITQAEDDEFEGYLSKVAQAGLILNQGIRANEAATTLSTQVNSFLDAFNALNNSGVAGIKNPGLKLTLSTSITGAESSVAIIAAAEGK
jgi:hypothetical protein